MRILALVCCFFFCSCVRGPFIFEHQINDRTHSPSNDLRVASFNIRYPAKQDGKHIWEKRKELCVATINKIDADIIGLQEVLLEQLTFIRDACPQYSYHGVGRKGKNAGEFTPIFYNQKRFSALRSGYFWLSETPHIPASKGWDASLPRIATWIVLHDHAATEQQPILFLNTHFDHQGKLAQKNSTQLIINQILLLEHTGPIIICGDFNIKAEDTLFREMLDNKHLKLQDGLLFSDAERSTQGTFHAYQGGSDCPRIDWLFHSPDLKRLSSTILRDHKNGLYPSDHYPIVLDCTYD